MKAPTAASRPARSGRRREFASMVVGASLPLLAVTGALLIGAWMLVLLDADPITAYGALIEGAFGSTSGIAQSRERFSKLARISESSLLTEPERTLYLSTSNRGTRRGRAAALRLSLPRRHSRKSRCPS